LPGLASRQDAPFELALQIDPTNVHARTRQVNVQIRIADGLFAGSKFDLAIDALAKASKYSPHDDRVAGFGRLSSRPRSSATSWSRTTRSIR
jgi:hypothetical protein